MQNDSVAAQNDSIDNFDVPGMTFSSVSELKKYIDASKDASKYNSGIIPHVAVYSLDYASRLMNNKFSGFIIVDKSRMRVVLFDRYGREKLSYGMACAKRYGTKNNEADSRTPEVYFSAEGVYDSTDWLFTDDNGRTSKVKGQFGPRFIRLRCPNTSQIGIHGTGAPWSIGTRASHGCIRITNENILEFVKHVEVGMPIIVVPGKKDMEVNESEGYESVWIPSSLDAKSPEPSKNEIEYLKKKAEKEAERRAQEAAERDSIAKLAADSVSVEVPTTVTPDNSASDTVPVSASTGTE